MRAVMSFKPIADRVLVLPDEPDDVSEAGLVMIRTYEEAEMSGTVAAVGPGARCPECSRALRSDLKPGDRVVFAAEDGQEVDYDGVTYLVLSEDQILGIVEDE